jgi:hypothetical protein
MLAEIYILKLEAAVRVVKEAATTASTSRFVPVTLPAPQGVLTRPSIAPSPSAQPQLGAPLGFRTIQVCPKDWPAILGEDRRRKLIDGIIAFGGGFPWL